MDIWWQVMTIIIWPCILSSYMIMIWQLWQSYDDKWWQSPSGLAHLSLLQAFLALDLPFARTCHHHRHHHRRHHRHHHHIGRCLRLGRGWNLHCLRRHLLLEPAGGKHSCCQFRICDQIISWFFPKNTTIHNLCKFDASDRNFCLTLREKSNTFLCHQLKEYTLWYRW